MLVSNAYASAIPRNRTSLIGRRQRDAVTRDRRVCFVTVRNRDYAARNSNARYILTNDVACSLKTSRRVVSRHRAAILVVRGRKQRILLVDHHLVQVGPVAAIDPVEDQALLRFGQTVDLIDDLDRKYRESRPDDVFIPLVQLPEIRPTDELRAREVERRASQDPYGAGGRYDDPYQDRGSRD